MSIQERTHKGRTTFRARVYRKGESELSKTFICKRDALKWEAYQKEERIVEEIQRAQTKFEKIHEANAKFRIKDIIDKIRRQAA